MIYNTDIHGRDFLAFISSFVIIYYASLDKIELKYLTLT